MFLQKRERWSWADREHSSGFGVWAVPCSGGASLAHCTFPSPSQDGQSHSSPLTVPKPPGNGNLWSWQFSFHTGRSRGHQMRPKIGLVLSSRAEGHSQTLPRKSRLNETLNPSGSLAAARFCCCVFLPPVSLIPVFRNNRST